jgi:hypothetical protein
LVENQAIFHRKSLSNWEPGKRASALRASGIYEPGAGDPDSQNGLCYNPGRPGEFVGGLDHNNYAF